MKVNILSFGYKYGVPDANLLFDVRFLDENEIPLELEDLSGLDDEIIQIVLDQPELALFMDKVISLVESYVPLYDKSDITDEITIGIGCESGRHRSVAIAGFLNDALLDSQQQYDNYYSYEVATDHRDINLWEFVHGTPAELDAEEWLELGMDAWLDHLAQEED